MKNLIDNFLKTKSQIASNRTVKKTINGIVIVKPVMYLHNNFIETYKLFPCKDVISTSAFYKHVKASGIYKKPYRITDICDYCEWYKLELPKIKNFFRRFNDLVYIDTFNPRYLIEFIETKKKSIINDEDTSINKVEIK